MPYARFRPDTQLAPSSRGWDAWAEDYGKLGEGNPVYAFGKMLLHELVDRIVPPPSHRTACVLDFNCGAGDDLVRFLARGWHAIGCDGSTGMLRAAAGRLTAGLREQRVELWQGLAEEIDPTSFGMRKFDLIFSTTGGFVYLDDAAFVRVHRTLRDMLAPGGVFIVAHLTPFCVSETLYHFAHLSPRRALQRWRGAASITVRGEPMHMCLRSPTQIRRLLAGVLRIERQIPLLLATPPFQSGFVPGPTVLKTMKPIERLAMHAEWLASFADQAVCVARPIAQVPACRRVDRQNGH